MKRLLTNGWNQGVASAERLRTPEVPTHGSLHHVVLRASLPTMLHTNSDLFPQSQPNGMPPRKLRRNDAVDGIVLMRGHVAPAKILGDTANKYDLIRGLLLHR